MVLLWKLCAPRSIYTYANMHNSQTPDDSTDGAYQRPLENRRLNISSTMQTMISVTKD